MKTLYLRLLIVAISFGFSLAGFSQQINIINPLPTNVNSKLQLGLEEVVNLVETNQSLNELTLSGFPFYDLKANNTKIKVDIITAGDPNVLYKELVALELEIVARHKNIITCWVDIVKVKSLLGKTENIQWIQSSLKPIHNAGVVQSQGDAAQRSDIARSTYGLNGAGVKVGVLSDSYNNLNGAAAGVTAGELPGTTNPSGFTTPVVVLSDLSSGGSDEGRAMCEIVHDVAPGAQLYFYSAFNGQPDFANGIRALADAGCKVINDDITYFAEPIFQDGVIAQAIDYAVNVKGAVYFSSAGNSNNQSYEAPYQASTYQPFNDGQTAHNFGTAANPIYLLPVGGTIRLGFQWDEPYLSAGNGSPGSASDMNIYVLTTTDNVNFTVVSQGIVNNIGSDPNELINQVGGTNTKYILVTKKSGPNPTRIKITDFSRQLSWTPTPNTIVGIKAGTVTGHHNATGDITCGAASYDKTPAFGVTPPVIESYSSRGGTPIMFSVSGVRLPTPDDRLKPVITAPDNANTSFFVAGYDPENDGKPNFPGTSAAAPHAAGVAALMLQGNPGLSFAAIKTALINSCVDMDDDQTPSFDVGFDYRTGNGLIKADAAVAATINPNCPPSVVTITRPTTFCEGDSVIFNVNTGSGYTYLWRKNSIDIDGATSSTLIVKESGSYNVNVTNVDCTVSSEFIQVTKNPGVPPPTTISRTITFGTPITVGNGLQASTTCYDNPQTANYTGPTIGYDGGNSSGANPTISFSGLTGNVVKTRVSITWRKRAGGGGINDCGTTGSNGIPYNDEISFSIKSPNNTEVSLLDYGTYVQGTSPAGVVTTVFEDGGTAIGTTPASGTFAPAQSLTRLNEQIANGTWTLVPFDGIGGEPLCVQSFSVTVYVSGNTSPSTITWWTAATGGTQVGTGTEYIPADVNVGTYTYYAQGGCSNGFACNTSIRKPAILKINAPDLPPTPVATGATICKGASATLTATGCTGTNLTLLWYQNADDVEVTMPVSPTVTTQYYARCSEILVSGTSPLAVSEKSNVVSITVLDPAAPVATGTSINVGSSVTLTATGCTGSGFVLKWYQTADNVEVTMPVSPMVNTQYYAKCQQTVGSIVCLSAKSNDVTVTVSMVLLPPVATGVAICKGSSVTLTATGCTGTSLTLLWYQNADDAEVTMPVSPSTTTQYYARCRQETIETGETPYIISEKSNIVSVTVLDPAAPVATGTSINVGSSVTLTATGCTGSGFVLKWYQTADNVEVTMPVSPMVNTQYYAKCQQTVGSTVCLSAKSNDVTVTVVIPSVMVVYVNIANADAPVQNGSSWGTAYSNLQTALASAPANAEVWVAAGTYKPTTTANRNISFNIPSGMMLYGGFAGTELSQSQRNFKINKTILSGEIGTSSVNDNSYHVVLFNGANNTTVLDGFMIRSGNANLTDAQVNVEPSSGLPISVNDGGGIGLDNGSSPMIINCTITNNYAISGGGLFAANGSNPTVKNCMFTSNKATFGGGAYHTASNPTYNNVLFSGNNATGGAIYNNGANPTITNTTIAGNGGYNGAIFNASSSPVVKNSILWGNIAPFNDTQSITTYSIVEGGYNGVGNMNINPQFMNLVHFGLSPTQSGNYQLTNTSPAIDAGDNGSITITDKDLIDNLRRYNAVIVDMGAYEFQGSRVGTTIKSVTSGNWENSNTWNIGRIPLAGDNVIIDSNHNVTIMNSGTAKNVDVRSNAKIIYNQSLSKLQTGI